MYNNSSNQTRKSIKPGVIEVDGEVSEALPNTMFRVKVAAGQIPSVEEDKVLLCHLSGKMRVNFIKILPGDRVRIEMTPYDKTKGRITYRGTGR